MTFWEVIGSTGEWAGALAVVITLMYLARQIKQSNRLAKAEAERDFFHQWHDIVKALGADQETGSIIQRGLQSFSKLTPPEKAVFNTRVCAIFNETELSRRLCQQGLLSEDIFHSTLDVCVGIVLTSGGAEWWGDLRSSMPIAEEIDLRQKNLGSDAVPFDAWLAWQDGGATADEKP